MPLSGDDFSITTVDGSATQVLLLGTELEVKIAASTSKGQGPFTVARVFDGSGEAGTLTCAHRSTDTLMRAVYGGALVPDQPNSPTSLQYSALQDSCTAIITFIAYT